MWPAMVAAHLVRIRGYSTTLRRMSVRHFRIDPVQNACLLPVPSGGHLSPRGAAGHAAGRHRPYIVRNEKKSCMSCQVISFQNSIVCFALHHLASTLASAGPGRSIRSAGRRAGACKLVKSSRPRRVLPRLGPGAPGVPVSSAVLSCVSRLLSRAPARNAPPRSAQVPSCVSRRYRGSCERLASCLR